MLFTSGFRDDIIFHVMGHNAGYDFSTGTAGADINVSQLFHILIQWSYTMTVNFAPGTKSPIDDCLVVCVCWQWHVYQSSNEIDNYWLVFV